MNELEVHLRGIMTYQETYVRQSIELTKEHYVILTNFDPEKIMDILPDINEKFGLYQPTQEQESGEGHMSARNYTLEKQEVQEQTELSFRTLLEGEIRRYDDDRNFEPRFLQAQEDRPSADLLTSPLRRSRPKRTQHPNQEEEKLGRSFTRSLDRREEAPAPESGLLGFIEEEEKQPRHGSLVEEEKIAFASPAKEGQISVAEGARNSRDTPSLDDR